MTPDLLKRLGGRRLDRRLMDISQAIRQSLDTEETVRLSAQAVHDVIRPGQTSIWLGAEKPRLVHCIGGPACNGREVPIPAVVRQCIKRRKPTLNPMYPGVAVPIVAPRSGFLGVIHIDRMGSDPDQHVFVETIARETSLALETANLYERAVAEKEKTEAILARVGDAVVVTDVRGTISQWNKAAERTFGCSQRDAVGSSCACLLGLKDGDRELDCTDGCALLAKALTQDYELSRERKDGSRQPLLATAEVVRDRDGKVSEVVHSFRDVTRLKEADEAKTLFLATASHELKTPLTVIRGFAETLMSDHDWSEEERDKALEAMGRRTVDLSKIVDRILLSSRIEAGRTRVSVTELDPKPILLERIDGLRASNGHQVSADIAADLPAVLADADALTTVVDHLLDNAVKYSPVEGLVTVGAEADESWVRMRIGDEGIGMDSEALSRCFDKFWQAESSDVRRFGGTGIGLYIVRSLVEAMGGEVRAESAPAQGTTFEVSLVRAGASTPTAMPAPEETVEPGIGDPSVIREFMRQIGIPARREQ